jgi:hypothetical protein
LLIVILRTKKGDKILQKGERQDAICKVCQ